MYVFTAIDKVLKDKATIKGDGFQEILLMTQYGVIGP